jgi:hypothetical protein
MSTVPRPELWSDDYTVVISTFNRARFLSEAIGSVLQQTLPPRRVVVVSDGSTDNTQEVVNSFGTKVEYIHLQNGGKARALNCVLPSIETTFCWFFDDDDFALPDAAQSMLAAFRAAPEAAFAFGSWEVVVSDGELASIHGQEVRYRFADLAGREQSWQLFRQCTVMMTGAMLRTSCVRAVGGLNETLIRGQDYDLMVRLAAKFDMRYCGQCVYRWRQHDGHRGSASLGHKSGDRLAVWAAASQPVGDFLRNELPIEAWTRSGASPSLEREAHIRRVWALASKQAIQVSVDQLRVAFSIDSRSSISATERALLTEALAHDFVSFRGPLRLLRLVGLPVGQAGAEGAAAIARGLWWLARGDPRRISALQLRLTSLGLVAVSWWLGLTGALSK